jgi:hypothetical protein
VEGVVSRRRDSESSYQCSDQRVSYGDDDDDQADGIGSKKLYGKHLPMRPKSSWPNYSESNRALAPCEGLYQ